MNVSLVVDEPVPMSLWLRFEERDAWRGDLSWMAGRHRDRAARGVAPGGGQLAVVFGGWTWPAATPPREALPFAETIDDALDAFDGLDAPGVSAVGYRSSRRSRRATRRAMRRVVSRHGAGQRRPPPAGVPGAVIAAPPGPLTSWS